MTMFVIVALTVAAIIWDIMVPKSPQGLTADEMIDLVALGFVP
jgi:hypothetical protein